MVAARLVALLPRPANPNIPSRATSFGAGAVTHPQAIIYVYVIFMVFALGAQWIAANRLPAAQVGNVYAPASSTVSAQGRPPISGGTDDTIARRVPEVHDSGGPNERTE
jgi:hypothetical protein